MTYEPDAKMRAWCNAHGWDTDLHSEYFNDFLANTSRKYKDLDAAFRNCCRSDWGRIRFQAEMKARKPADNSDAGIIARAAERGILPKIGETMYAFKARANA